MMNNLKLIIKYMKNQSKKTLSIILGIILTSMLLTIIGLISYNLKFNIIENGEKLYGDYYANICNFDKEKSYDLINDSYITTKVIHAPYGEFLSKNKKTSLSIEACENGALKCIGIEMLKGNFPNNKDEICIDECFLENMKLPKKLNQKITLNLTSSLQNNNSLYKQYSFIKTFKLVGILKSSPGLKFSGVSYAVVPMKNINDLPKDFINYNIFVKTSCEKSLSKIKNSIQSIQDNFNIEEKNVNLNQGLMQTIKYSNDFKSIDIVLKIIVIIASVLTIYNIFNMSVLNKVKDFGILRCLGFRKSKIFLLVLQESLLLSLIAIPIGILLGYLLSFSIYKYVCSILIINTGILRFSIKTIISTIIITLISIFLSTFLPAIYASKTPPIQAVRNLNMYSCIFKIKRTKFQSILKKFLKSECLLAYKNLWRIKKRTYIIISSLGFSIITFIVFTYCFNHIPMIDASQNFKNGQFKLTFNDQLSNQYCYDDSIIEKISKIKGVKNITKIQSTVETVVLNKQSSKPNLKQDKFNNNLEIKDGNYLVPGNITGCTSKMIIDLNNKIKDGSIAYNGSLKSNEILLVTDEYFQKNIKLKVGDEMIIRRFFKEDSSNKLNYEDKKFKIKAILTKSPYIPTTIGISIIMGNDAFKNFTKINGYRTVDINVYENANKDVINNILTNLVSNVEGGKLLSYYKEIKYIKNKIRTIKLLVYSFIVFIALIGTLNIINTMNTNITLRTREFGTLRAIGFNKNQIRRVVVFEGFFYGFLSSMFGIVISSILCGLLYKLVPDMKPGFSIHIFWIPILFTILISILASMIPLNKVEKLNIIDSINEL